ncbi:MAG: hypothetical protein AB1420_17720 [Bacillota bacterium]
MNRRLSYLQYQRNALLSDYKSAKENDKVKILVKIMDLEEEIRHSDDDYSALKRQAL